jgi:polyhydroxybutyrate depolymerase
MKRSAGWIAITMLMGCEAAAVPDDGGRSDTAMADAGRSDTAMADAGPVDGGGGASSGCGTPSGITPGEWTAQTITVGGAERSYFVRLPEGYDEDRAYPVVYQLHGCSDSATREDNNVRLEGESGPDAILVRGRAAERCWDTAPGGPDVPYFDAMVAAVESAVCTDPTRRFLSGYSSGSFMSHALACTHGDMLRGVATIAGGQGGGGCTGSVAALLIHDRNDGTVNISASEGARDAHAMRNGCDTDAARTPTADPPCEAYVGCDPGLPVVWCETSGEDHSRQDALAAPIFWNFFSAL